MRVLHFILGLFLLPFYPLLKRRALMAEKIQIGEKVVVIKEKQGKKIYIQK